jgi:Lon protease-like protein
MNSWDTPELQFDADTFSGVVRLFPLPNLVLYPHVMQPLHIFEERYREMLEDALADDQLIAMALLEPGWEQDYDSRPPIEPLACLGKVVAHHRLEDGTYNVLLLGVQRVRIVEELDPLRSFRQAQVELIEDCYDFATPADRDRLQQKLLAAFRKHLPCSCQLPEQLEELLSRHLPLGLLADLAAYALPLDLQVKQELLSEARVSVRVRMLLSEIKQKFAGQKSAPHKGGFPPLFSEN